MTVAQSGSYHNVPFTVQAVQNNESVIICPRFDIISMYTIIRFNVQNAIS